MAHRNVCLSVAALMLVGAVGCGYHLVGTSSYLPEELELLYVEPFTNQTRWAVIDQRLSEAITQEWVRRRRFQLVESAAEAQLVLKGVITSIRVSPVRFDQQGRATEYQMAMYVAVQLLDVRGDEPALLWEDRGFSRQTSYDVDVSAVNYFDRQVEAMEELSAEFARALVTAVLEGF
jgi:outer membrane lipopolysaccharide assembly protein LptE/RlpB